MVSTPVTNWFTSTCERGPGIAGFLAMARLAETFWPDLDLVFVATSGHEIGHGGMEHFLQTSHPVQKPPGMGAFRRLAGLLRLAPRRRALGHRSPGRHSPAPGAELAGDGGLGDAALQGRRGHAPDGHTRGIGELRDVLAAGYPRFFGMAGSHTFYHNVLHSRRRPDRRSWYRSSGPLRGPWMTPPAMARLRPFIFLSPARGEVRRGESTCLSPHPASPPSGEEENEGRNPLQSTGTPSRPGAFTG